MPVVFPANLIDKGPDSVGRRPLLEGNIMLLTADDA
jgi:hypothetical protein